MLIDQHYYAIASKATILKPDQIPVPKQLFEDSFGLSYESALADGLVFNAKDACTHLGVDAMGYVLYASTLICCRIKSCFVLIITAQN